jgi:hypothetical protein
MGCAGRRLRTWNSLVHLRFRQDTRDEKAGRSLRGRFGDQAFRLWEADVKSYAPAVDALLVQESKLVADYTSPFGTSPWNSTGAA